MLWRKHSDSGESPLISGRYADRRANVKNKKPVRIRVLTAEDMHQFRLHYRSLVLATQEHRPDVVAIVGDALHGFGI